MSTTCIAPPRIADVQRAVRAVAASIPLHVDVIERERRLPNELVDELRATGLNRLVIPEELGGEAAPVADVLDIAEELAAADGSVGWAATIGSGSNFFAGYMPEAGARQVFADPDQGNATMLAPAGRLTNDRGTLRLDGRWPFASNCLHSAWAGLGAMVQRADDEQTPVIVYVPVADLRIEDTWDSVGLRGTGSHHLVADAVVVEPEHCFSFIDRPWADGTLWRLPPFTVLLPMLAAVPLGIARGALDEIGRQVREGRDARRGNLTDDPVSLAAYADADSSLASCTSVAPRPRARGARHGGGARTGRSSPPSAGVPGGDPRLRSRGRRDLDRSPPRRRRCRLPVEPAAPRPVRRRGRSPAPVVRAEASRRTRQVCRRPRRRLPALRRVNRRRAGA